MTPHVDIAVESDLWDALDAHGIAQTAISATLRQFGGELPNAPEVSVVLGDDAFIADLNARWRNQPKATNVLSFPAADPSHAMLGDIVVAFETIAREAADEGKTIGAHLAHLFVHGTLHLLGRDHLVEAEAVEMEDMERAVLARLGIADPYAEAMAGEPQR